MPATTPVALVTGAAHRLGAETAMTLHKRGWNLVIHYRSREAQAHALIKHMNRQRPDSACALQADLSQVSGVNRLASDAMAQWNRLDALVNNASVFHPTPTGDVSEDDWNTTLHTNLRAPFFLLQACLTELRQNRGSVVNLIDIYSERPIDNHPLYCASKAGLAALTRSWAKDLAPDVRVNGVSPGAILWPEGEAEMDHTAQQAILDKTPLARTGNPDDIAETIAFLICDAPFITGQIIAVDGGHSLNM